MKLSAYEKRNYLMPDKKDFLILSKIKKLEQKKLSKTDKDTIKLIRTQLKKDWRTPLIKYLNKLAKKYKK